MLVWIREAVIENSLQWTELEPFQQHGQLQNDAWRAKREKE